MRTSKELSQLAALGTIPPLARARTDPIDTTLSKEKFEDSAEVKPPVGVEHFPRYAYNPPPSLTG